MRLSNRGGASFVRLAALTAFAAAAGNALGVNLVVNGSFETPIVTTAGQFATIPGWTLSCGPSIEVQGPALGLTAADGLQWWEADSLGNSCISQSFTTSTMSVYRLSYWYSPRPGIAINDVEVWWNGVLIATHSASGVGNSNNAWVQYQHVLAVTGASTTLEFRAAGPSDALGGYIDDAVLEECDCRAFCAGDADGDGDVDFNDILTSLANFGSMCP